MNSILYSWYVAAPFVLSLISGLLNLISLIWLIDLLFTQQLSMSFLYLLIAIKVYNIFFKLYIPYKDRIRYLGKIGS